VALLTQATSDNTPIGASRSPHREIIFQLNAVDYNVLDYHVELEGHMRHETILVVDDEQLIRKLIHFCLKRHGYTVLEASSGAEAIEICKIHKGKIDLALVDVIMPGLHGPHLKRSPDKLHPDMHMLFMSGFPHVEAINRGMDDFVSKPFTCERLLKQVHSALTDRIPTEAHLEQLQAVNKSAILPVTNCVKTDR